jgi:hypothetical protein
VKYIVNFLSLMVGGIFGIYLIALFLNWRQHKIVRKMAKQMQQLTEDMAFLKKELNKRPKK